MHREWRRSAEEAAERPSFRWSRPKRSSTSVMDANAEPTPPSPPRRSACCRLCTSVPVSSFSSPCHPHEFLHSPSSCVREPCRRASRAVAGRWWVGIRSRSTAGGGGSSTMRRAATQRERQIQGCVNGYREWRKPNMSFKNMDVIDVFCYRLSVGGDFLGEQYLQGPILNMG
jgi:hypothetical protein